MGNGNGNRKMGLAWGQRSLDEALLVRSTIQQGQPSEVNVRTPFPKDAGGETTLAK